MQIQRLAWILLLRLTISTIRTFQWRKVALRVLMLIISLPAPWPILEMYRSPAVTVSDDLAGDAIYVSGDDGNDFLEVGEIWIFTANYVVTFNDSQI